MPPRRRLLVAAILAIVSASAVAQRDWIRMRDPVGYFPIVFDAARERLFVFGGQGSEPGSNQTFEWDAIGGWQQRLPAVSPPGRYGQGMVYDAARRRVVMFGGEDDSAAVPVLGDTWEWDGAAWTQRTPAQSPPARVGAAMAHDRLRQRCVLFGGRLDYATMFGDTWEWDGVTWVNSAPALAPSARTDAAMAFDPRNRRVLLFGGYAPSGFFVPETWLWNGVRWQSVATAASPASAGAVAEDPVRARLLFAEASSSVDWEWDGRAWTQLPASGAPRPIDPGGVAFDAASGRAVAAFRDGELWQLQASGWKRAAAKQSLDLVQYEMCTDYTTGRVVAFGMRETGEFATFELRDGQWVALPSTTPSTEPAQLFEAMAEGDILRGRIVVFGGMDVNGAMSDRTFEWDGTSWGVVAAAVRPPGRFAGRLALDVALGRVLLFGGETTAGGQQHVLDDTWTFDGASWSQLQPATHPTARSNHAMASDILRGRIVLFGGSSATGIEGDTWEWNGTDWQLRATLGPSPRVSSVCDYDLMRGHIVLHGGNFLNDTWEWDGQSWTQILFAAPPPGTQGARLAFDLATGDHVLGPGIVCGRLLPCFRTLGSWRLAIPVAPAANSFGVACGGSGGALTLGSDAPYAGNAAFSFEVRNAPAGAPCAVALSTVQQTVPLGSGCTAYLGAPFADVLFATANASGVARARNAVPTGPRFVGATLYAQAVTLDPLGPLGGLAISDARQLTIGR